MGNRSRFGKYGEIKRLGRLQQARISSASYHRPGVKSLNPGTSSKKADFQKVRVKIRPANRSDADFISQLSEKVFNIYGPYKDTVSGWFESEMTVTVIALVEKRPVGFAIIGHISNEYHLQQVPELLAIAVEPEKQQTGIGQMLIKEVERKAAEMNVERLLLHTCKENLLSRKLFMRNGYSPCGIKRKFYPAGQDALVMSKHIGS